MRSSSLTRALAMLSTILFMTFALTLGSFKNITQCEVKKSDDPHLKDLENHGILFQVAWWHNIGGVISGSEEYENQELAKIENVFNKLDNIVPSKTGDNLNEAKSLGITPTENAYRTVEKTIYPY